MLGPPSGGPSSYPCGLSGRGETGRCQLESRGYKGGARERKGDMEGGSRWERVWLEMWGGRDHLGRDHSCAEGKRKRTQPGKRRLPWKGQEGWILHLSPCTPLMGEIQSHERCEEFPVKAISLAVVCIRNTLVVTH